MHEQEIYNILNNIKLQNTTFFNFPWEFEVKQIASDYPSDSMFGYLIRLSFQRPDTETGIMGTGYGRWEFVNYDITESGLVKTAWLLLELLVRHELMEAFRYKGCRIFNPHHSVQELMTLEKNRLT